MVGYHCGADGLYRRFLGPDNDGPDTWPFCFVRDAMGKLLRVVRSWPAIELEQVKHGRALVR